MFVNVYTGKHDFSNGFGMYMYVFGGDKQGWMVYVYFFLKAKMEVGEKVTKL